MLKCKARITKLSKDDMRICSSRVIWAELEDESGKKYSVAWADSPTIMGITGNWASRNKDSFLRAWCKSEVGDIVYLYHADDSSYNFFEPI